MGEKCKSFLHPSCSKWGKQCQDYFLLLTGKEKVKKWPMWELVVKQQKFVRRAFEVGKPGVRESLYPEEYLMIWRLLALKTWEQRNTALKWGNCVFVSKHIELIHYEKEIILQALLKIEPKPFPQHCHWATKIQIFEFSWGQSISLIN